jgi:hypothetical protein
MVCSKSSSGALNVWTREVFFVGLQRRNRGGEGERRKNDCWSQGRTDRCCSLCLGGSCSAPHPREREGEIHMRGGVRLCKHPALAHTLQHGAQKQDRSPNDTDDNMSCLSRKNNMRSSSSCCFGRLLKRPGIQGSCETSAFCMVHNDHFGDRKWLAQAGFKTKESLVRNPLSLSICCFTASETWSRAHA